MYWQGSLGFVYLPLSNTSESIFKNVDINDICEAVFYELNELDVHELWDRSGTNSDGYTSPEDMSVEMFEEALGPFEQEMKRLLNLKMFHEAKLYCMGILKGLYQYEKDSKSEFKSWAVDVPEEAFGGILSDWAKHKTTDKEKLEMKEFIENEFPKWAKWAMTQL